MSCYFFHFNDSDIFDAANCVIDAGKIKTGLVMRSGENDSYNALVFRGFIIPDVTQLMRKCWFCH